MEDVIKTNEIYNDQTKTFEKQKNKQTTSIERSEIATLNQDLELFWKCLNLNLIIWTIFTKNILQSLS